MPASAGSQSIYSCNTRPVAAHPNSLYQSSNIREARMSHVRISYETFQKTAPAAQAALLAMGKSTEESGLDKSIVELVKLRVSQINNCAFCLQIHLNVSRRLGVPQEKLDLMATWYEAGIFSDKECAAL